MADPEDPRRETDDLRVERDVDLQELERHAEAWDALAEASGHGAAMFASHAWVSSRLEHRLEPGERWACYRAWAQDRLVGVLPVVRSRHPLAGPLAARLRVPADFHCGNGEPLLARGGTEADVFDALCTAVDREERPFVDLCLGSLRSDSPVYGLLEERAGAFTTLEQEMAGRELHIDGDWDAYRRRLGKSTQRNLRRWGHRVAAPGRARWTFLAGDDASASFVDDFLALESSGWKGRAGTAIAAHAPSHAFYRAVVQRFAARGWLEWNRLELDGRLAAAHLALRLGRRRVLLRIAYDEGFGRDAPGNLLFAAVLERAFETRDVDWVDCITDMAWHPMWRLAKYPYHSARIDRKSVAGFLLGAVPERLRAQVRTWRRRLRPAAD